MAGLPLDKTIGWPRSGRFFDLCDVSQMENTVTGFDGEGLKSLCVAYLIKAAQGMGALTDPDGSGRHIRTDCCHLSRKIIQRQAHLLQLAAADLQGNFHCWQT